MSGERFISEWKYDVNEPNAIMTHIEAGKLGKNGRVDQAAQKGETCSYYVMNYLRDRIGKVVPAGMEEKRKLESLISKQRKEYTKLTIVRACEWALVSTAAQYINVHRAEHRTIDSIQETLIRTVQVFLADPGFNVFFEQTNGYPFLPEHQEYMKEFIRELKSTYQYYLSKGYPLQELLDIVKLTELKQSKAFISFYEKCFKAHHLDVNELYNMFRKDCSGIVGIYPLPSSLNDFQDDAKNMILHQIYLMNNLRLNNIKQSNWHPKDGIDGLINLIRERGPLMASGFIGKHYYDESSIVDLKVGKIHARGFKPNSAKISKDSDAHVILIIGVTKCGYEKSKSDLVYYIDPKIPQKANRPLVVFTVSYTTFVKRLIESHGVRGNDDLEYWTKIPGARFLHFRDRAEQSSVTAREEKPEEGKKLTS